MVFETFDGDAIRKMIASKVRQRAWVLLGCGI